MFFVHRWFHPVIFIKIHISLKMMMMFKTALSKGRFTPMTKSVLRPFSTAPTTENEAGKHKQEHIDATLHPKFFEDSFVHTSIAELEYVRSPFYDLARHEHLKEGEDASEFLTSMQLKIEMTQFLNGTALQSPFPNKKNVAFTRYADELHDKVAKEKL